MRTANDQSAPQAMAIVFRSKVDAWLGAVMIAGAIACVGAVLVIGVARDAATALALSPLILAGGVFPLWILRTTHYTLDSSELVARSGPFKWRVPLRDIRAVTPTRNPLSSPALSLDRIRIDYARGRSLMISPAEKERFLAELTRRRGVA